MLSKRPCGASIWPYCIKTFVPHSSMQCWPCLPPCNHLRWRWALKILFLPFLLWKNFSYILALRPQLHSSFFERLVQQKGHSQSNTWPELCLSLRMNSTVTSPSSSTISPKFLAVSTLHEPTEIQETLFKPENSAKNSTFFVSSSSLKPWEQGTNSWIRAYMHITHSQNIGSETLLPKRPSKQ